MCCDVEAGRPQIETLFQLVPGLPLQSNDPGRKNPPVYVRDQKSLLRLLDLL